RICRDVYECALAPDMGSPGSTFCQLRQRLTRPPQGEGFERFPTCEHQHDDGARQILSKHQRAANREDRDDVYTDLTMRQLSKCLPEEWNPAEQYDSDQAPLCRMMPSGQPGDEANQQQTEHSERQR